MKAVRIVKNPLLIIAVIILSCIIGFNLWFNGGHMRAEVYNNPYFMVGDSEFIDSGEGNKFRIGFSKETITPEDYQEVKYYMGGYFTFPATYATEVLDDLYVRAICIDDNSGRGTVALAVIDSIGLSNKDVNYIRQKLWEFAEENNIKSINVLTTHLHSGIDTQGLWGPLPKSGKNTKFMDNLFETTAKAITDAYNAMSEGELYYAETVAEGMFADWREPIVVDETIVRLRFVPDNLEQKEIYIINLSAHPEALMHGNKIITADFPAYMGRVIEDRGGEFLFINGSIGGLINASQLPNHEELTDIEEMIEYGTILGELIMDIDNETEVRVDPIINICHSELRLPLENSLLRFAGKVGIINNQVVKVRNKPHKIELITEIGYMELGTKLKIMLIPGELFPELAIGGTLDGDKSFSGESFNSPLLKDIVEGRLIIFGLANDEIGYIITDNDFGITKRLPYINSVEGHYEETVSAGPNTASIMIEAMRELIGGVR